MKFKKDEFQILRVNDVCYTIIMRKKLFWFIYTWAPVTYQEAEHTEDKPMMFCSFNEATDFIETIAE